MGMRSNGVKAMIGLSNAKYHLFGFGLSNARPCIVRPIPSLK